MKQLGNLILKINNMNNKQTTLILGWVYLIAGIFSSYEINIICSSIFFSANFVIDEMNKNKNNHSILKSKVWFLYESYFSSLQFGHNKGNCQKYLDEIEKLLTEEIKNLNK